MSISLSSKTSLHVRYQPRLFEQTLFEVDSTTKITVLLYENKSPVRKGM